MNLGLKTHVVEGLDQAATEIQSLNSVPRGRVYVWHPQQSADRVGNPMDPDSSLVRDANHDIQSGEFINADQSGDEHSQHKRNDVFKSSHAGRVELEEVPLLRLKSPDRLCGQYVTVHNASELRLPGEISPAAVPLGDACPNDDGNFLFNPHLGGGRVEKNPYHDAELWRRYIEASRFGEVNSYYHLDRVASYVDRLLGELGLASLPPVLVKVNAHNAVGQVDGQIDGVCGKKTGKWYPLQGGHYRLPTLKTLTVKELHAVAATGEIHLGPGWKYARAGALIDHAMATYRSNASHNAGTLYHEYGHHLTRHTADFRGNDLGDPRDQCNYKTDSDEAFCDYLAATMLNSPHIWAFHHRHDDLQVHRRSLVSSVTLDDYCHEPGADPHANGTILAATLWDLRERMLSQAGEGDRQRVIHDLDLMVVNSLILIGQLKDHPTRPTIAGTRRLRRGFGTVRQALLYSCKDLFENQYRDAIRAAFRQRKIGSRNRKRLALLWQVDHESMPELDLKSESLEKIKIKTRQLQLPSSTELMTGNQLEVFLKRRCLGPYCLVAVGDVMLGSRARRRIDKFGCDYVFHATKPLFRRSAIVLGNQEGPIARQARRQPRNYSYKVSPKYTAALKRAGFNVLNLANNHMLDCGREGVIETIDNLDYWGIRVVGAGRDREFAHRPVILNSGGTAIGILGYYWNRRTSATNSLPGTARDKTELLEHDIHKLKNWVDRVVVNVHWGVPYRRYPDEPTRQRASQMIAFGADLVIGHHPHIIQSIELIDGKPVIYSIGNFAFGTGNSKAESLVVAVKFCSHETVVDFFPAYVKNRDPRINYQPKLMTGGAAEAVINKLRLISPVGEAIELHDGFGRMVCKR